jgi:chorismate mutase
MLLEDKKILEVKNMSLKPVTVRLSEEEQEMLKKLVEHENEHSISKVTAADILRAALRESYSYVFPKDKG